MLLARSMRRFSSGNAFTRQNLNTGSRVAAQLRTEEIYSNPNKFHQSKFFNRTKKTNEHLNIMVFGAPGVGKGTFGKLIERDFSFKTFSTGDYFREVVKMANSEDGTPDEFTLKINEILKSGKFVDDGVVVDIVQNLIENQDTFMDGQFAGQKGLILDGMPRTVQQAEMLYEFAHVDLIINFFSLEEVIIQKLGGRRICPVCNKNFNVADVDTQGYRMTPLLPSEEDDCVKEGYCKPDEFITREDDKPEVIKNRLDLYREQTLPIIDFFRSKPYTEIMDFEAKNGKKDYPKLKEKMIEIMGFDYLRDQEPESKK